MDLYSRYLQRSVPVTCVLPVDSVRFASEPLSPLEKPLKSLYLLNGYFGNQLDWLVVGNIVPLANKYNMAIFCPAGENKMYIDCPATGDYFGSYIGEELVEQTRRIFNISHEREDSFIGGLSMGGYGALRNGLKYCDTFGYIVALSAGIKDVEELRRQLSGDFSPMKGFAQAHAQDPLRNKLMFGTPEEFEGSDNDIYAAAKRALEQGKMPQVYMACGTEDGLIDKNRAYAAFLKEQGAQVVWEEGPGGHDWVFWPHYLQRAAEQFLPVSAQAGETHHAEVKK